MDRSLFARCIAVLFLLAAAMPAIAAKNKVPTVTLTSPVNGASFIAPANVPLAATASDSDGTVVRVDFFAGSTLIGTSTTPPYQATWTGAPAGTHSITARATDNNGGTGTSAAATITVASATSLVITSPADGAPINVNAGFTVSGTYEGPSTGNTILVDDPNRSVLATITGNSYSASLGGGLNYGPNTITVRLSRADRSHVTRSITVNGHSNPVVAFTAPSSTNFDAPATITFRVDAKTPGGTVSQVQFLRNGTPVGTVTSPPYEVTLSNLTNGTYNITANATSNHGLLGSAVMTVQVLGPNTPPTVSITSPAPGTVFGPAPANVPITASASDPDGTVTLVEFFADGNLIGVDNTSPYNFTWTNVAAGNYVLTARATDNRNGQTTSAPVNITVAPPNAPPTATLLTPTDGAVFSVPGTVTFSATAEDSDGTISRVDYLQGNTVVASSTQAPSYPATFTFMQPGTYLIKARAVDNFNTPGDSQTVTINVNGSITFIHNDFAGNPITATDPNGQLLWRENFRPYGERINFDTAAAGNRQWFHGKAFDSDTGLSYFGARYYDPTIGRFMGTDAVGFVESNVNTFNRYSYGNSNPYKFIDLDGRESVIVGDRIVIRPELAGVPSFSIPNNVGASGVSASSLAFHKYDVRMATDLNASVASTAIGEAIARNPTPGLDSPATPSGTINNVGAIPTGGANNFVRSYTVKSPDPSRYTDITVNYTISGLHSLKEGFVVRYGEIGANGTITLRSYGEGNNWRQSEAMRKIWGPQVEKVWQGNHREILESVQ